MHISAIDAPSDQYGAVSDVARPLIHKLNQASMSSSTYESLHKLLVWGLAQLEGNVAADLKAFNGYSFVADEKPATESTPNESSEGGEGNDLTENQTPATGAENAPANDSGENTPETPVENTENVAGSTEGTELVAGIPAKVLTLDMLPDGDDEQAAPVEPAPVAEAPKVVTNPSVKAKAK